MINHVRTLLMNLDGAAAGLTPGEQYVPVEFTALLLPAYLTAFRALLFGHNPDRTMLNYRLAQYMALLHATELRQYVLALDPRVTYTLETGGVRGDLFQPSTYIPQIVGPPGLYLQGRPASPDIQGRMFYSYSLSLPDASLTQLSPRPLSVAVVPSFTSGLSQPIALLASGYSSLIPETSPGDSEWHISVYNRPQWDLGQIALGLRTAGAVNLLQLFGPAPAEPFLTFANLFNTHSELGYSLGGLLLAVAYRMDLIRQGGGNG